MQRRTRAQVESSMAARRERAAQASQITSLASRIPYDVETVDYLDLCGQVLLKDRAKVEMWITDVCPECGDTVQEDMDDHAALALEDGTVVLLIGCEGAFILNPNAIGMHAPNWQNWAVEGEYLFTFKVPYVVIAHKTVITRADRIEQATSNMLAAMLDAGLEVRPEWTCEKTEIPR